MATKQRQNWSLEQDILLCREVLVTRPYQFTKRSKESASGWSKIALTLNTVEGFAGNNKSGKRPLQSFVIKAKSTKKHRRESFWDRD